MDLEALMNRDQVATFLAFGNVRSFDRWRRDPVNEFPKPDVISGSATRWKFRTVLAWQILAEKRTADKKHGARTPADRARTPKSD